MMFVTFLQIRSFYEHFGFEIELKKHSLVADLLFATHRVRVTHTNMTALHEEMERVKVQRFFVAFYKIILLWLSMR